MDSHNMKWEKINEKKTRLPLSTVFIAFQALLLWPFRQFQPNIEILPPKKDIITSQWLFFNDCSCICSLICRSSRLNISQFPGIQIRRSSFANCIKFGDRRIFKALKYSYMFRIDRILRPYNFQGLPFWGEINLGDISLSTASSICMRLSSYRG